MKTAISIPDDVFQRVEDFARRKRITRSAVFTAAVKEYMELYRDDGVTEKLNEIYAEQPSPLDPVLQELQQRSLPPEEW